MTNQARSTLVERLRANARGLFGLACSHPHIVTPSLLALLDEAADHVEADALRQTPTVDDLRKLESTFTEACADANDRAKRLVNEKNYSGAAKVDAEAGAYAFAVAVAKRFREAAALRARPDAPPDRDPIVQAFDAGRALCIEALQRAIQATRDGKILPLTPDECVTILQNTHLPDCPIAPAERPDAPAVTPALTTENIRKLIADLYFQLPADEPQARSALRRLEDHCVAQASELYRLREAQADLAPRAPTCATCKHVQRNDFNEPMPQIVDPKEQHAFFCKLLWTAVPSPPERPFGCSLHEPRPTETP